MYRSAALATDHPTVGISDNPFRRSLPLTV
jgi:hypothetical protein